MKFDESERFDSTETFDSNNRVIPVKTYTGNKAIPITFVPDNATHVTLAVPRQTSSDNTIWNNPAVKVDVRVELSLNNGPWLDGGGFSAFGGIHTRRDGTQGGLSSIRIPLPPGINRRVRATVNFSGNCKTSCFVNAVLPVAQTGLDFQGNNGNGETAQLWFENPFPSIPATYIFRVRPRQQVGYFSGIFWSMRVPFDNTKFYLGGHPYPALPDGTPAPGQNNHKWEIACDGGSDILSAEDVVYDVFYTQVLRVRRVGTPVYEYVWDWDNQKMVTHTDLHDFPEPSNPVIAVGGAPWAPGTEEYNGVMRGFQFYDAYLDNAQVAQELASPGSVRTPWYLNLNPTPTDISDKSGSGHHPNFIGALRPILWSP